MKWKMKAASPRFLKLDGMLGKPLSFYHMRNHAHMPCLKLTSTDDLICCKSIDEPAGMVLTARWVAIGALPTCIWTWLWLWL